MSEPINRLTFDAAELVLDHPPRWRDPNKLAVYQIATSSGPFKGTIKFARWPEQPLPELVKDAREVSIVPGLFEYPSLDHPGRVDWYMNFADRNVFVAYGTSLLAQDELQVAEHPALASIREVLVAQGQPAATVDGEGRPTPITISGVQRRCVIDTLPNRAEGRPFGLYGNAFGRALVEKVKEATRALDPPTTSNILAMAAPSGGYGIYHYEEIEGILKTAYSGFLAAKWASESKESGSAWVVIHTGFWGCGAFGGNRELMTILQVLAADLAEVDLHFHAVDDAGAAMAEKAVAFYRRMRKHTDDVPRILGGLARQGYTWGRPDGT